MAYVNPFNPLTPAGTDPVGEGAARIREVKAALIERLDTYFENFPAGDPLLAKPGSVRLLVGLLSERPDAEGGLAFYATDNGRLYIGALNEDEPPVAEWHAVGGGADGGGGAIITRDRMERTLSDGALNTAAETMIPLNGPTGAYYRAGWPNEFYVDTPGVYELRANLLLELDTNPASATNVYPVHLRIRRTSDSDPYSYLPAFEVVRVSEYLSVSENLVREMAYSFVSPTILVSPGVVRRFMPTAHLPTTGGVTWTVKRLSVVELVRLGADF